ncbi:MAG: OmpH family outer membrane protein [Alphaproteobacteria bacterium]|nr:OmpH family outer membrane protein [Alphaproteobacteria bacterium]MBE8220431.1 OmpH family outer membrane protein [Alphaproteobacteria bacterium]
MTFIRITLLAAFIASIGSIGSVGVAQAEDLKILVFDVNRILVESKAGKSIGEQAQKMQSNFQDEIKSLQEKYKGKAEKLSEQRTLIAPDVLQSRVEELQIEQRRDERKMTAEVDSIRAGVTEAQRKLLEVAEKGLDKVAKKRQADLVLRRESLYFTSPSLDVTKEVVAYVNKELPRIKVTPITKEK